MLGCIARYTYGVYWEKIYLSYAKGKVIHNVCKGGRHTSDLFTENVYISYIKEKVYISCVKGKFYISYVKGKVYIS